MCLSVILTLFLFSLILLVHALMLLSTHVILLCWGVFVCMFALTCTTLNTTLLRAFVLMKCVLTVGSIFMRWSFMRSTLHREEMKLPHASDSVQHVVCRPNPSSAPHYQIPITSTHLILRCSFRQVGLITPTVVRVFESVCMCLFKCVHFPPPPPSLL